MITRGIESPSHDSVEIQSIIGSAVAPVAPYNYSEMHTNLAANLHDYYTPMIMSCVNDFQMRQHLYPCLHLRRVSHSTCYRLRLYPSPWADDYYLRDAVTVATLGRLLSARSSSIVLF